MNFVDAIAYLVFIGLGLIFGYMIGYGRSLADYEKEFNEFRKVYLDVIDACNEEVIVLHNKCRDLEVQNKILEEIVKSRECDGDGKGKSNG